MARTITSSVAAGSSRNRGVLMLAALFGVLSAGLMFAFLSNRDSGGGELETVLNNAGGAETVVVLTRDVAVGEKIIPEMLTTKAVPLSALLPGYLTSESEIVGKVATAPMYAGEQALLVKATTYEGQDTLAYKVPEGLRSLSLQIPHEAWAAAGLVQPGDRVDVLGVTTFMKVDPLTNEEKPNIVAGYIAEDVEVLAVSQTLIKVIPNVDPVQPATTSTEEGDPAAETTTTTGNTPVVNGALANEPGEATATYETAISITLALTPEQAAKVLIIDAMKDDAGQYRILARQKGETARLNGVNTWNFEDLFTISQ